MATFRVVTPDTLRIPGKPYADFEQGATFVGPITVVSDTLQPHGFEGCAVWKRKLGHWELIFDTTGSQRMTGLEQWMRTCTA